MEIDDIGSDNRHSVHDSLRRVLREKLTDNHPGNKLKILKLVVHVALLESGFVLFNPGSVSGKSVFYTLPEILQNDGEVIEGIVMVFPSLSPFFAAYRDGYPVWLDEKKFAPAMIDFVWGNNRFDDCHVNVGLLERQVMEIRNIVKNEIALPLLIDLCAVAGLRAPPCLMGLPAELGAKILKLLPGEDIARVSCVCEELRNLANDDELWKQKFAEEFGISSNEVGDRKSWKSWFVVNWNNKKETNKEKGKIIVGYWWRRKKYDREWPPLR